MPAQESSKKEPNQRNASGGLMRSILKQSARPLVSLAFILPLLVLYEAGVIYLGPQAVRNGADVWLRQLLDLSGFGQYFLLPALTIGLLLGWHHLTRDRWNVSAAVVYVMFAECAVMGLALVGLGRLQAMAAHALVDTPWWMSRSAPRWPSGACDSGHGPHRRLHGRGRLRRDDVSPPAVAARGGLRMAVRAPSAACASRWPSY